MANENTFKIIDIEDAIALYKMGLINEQACLDKIQLVLRGDENQLTHNIKDITNGEHGMDMD